MMILWRLFTERYCTFDDAWIDRQSYHCNCLVLVWFLSALNDIGAQIEMKSLIKNVLEYDTQNGWECRETA